MRTPKIYQGFDTETDELGNIVVVATDSRYAKVSTFAEFLKFMAVKDYKKSIFWTWNLQFDAEGIIKMALREYANDDTWREASAQITKGSEKDDSGMPIKGTEGWRFTIPELGDVKIFYIKSKMLAIEFYTVPEGCRKKRKFDFLFYDIAQFYGHKSLDSCAKKYLKKQKEDYGGWVNKVKRVQNNLMPRGELMGYLDRNWIKVGEYCKLDAELTLELTYCMKKGFEDAGVPFKKPLSQASIAGAYIDFWCRPPKPKPEEPKKEQREPEELKGEQRDPKKLIRGYPKIFEGTIEEFHNLAEHSYRGGMFENYQRGLIKEPLYDYDINSAYPFEMTKLPHWGNGRFMECSEPSSMEVTEYGWYLCEFDCPYIPFADTLNTYTIEFLFKNFHKEFNTGVEYNDEITALDDNTALNEMAVSNPRILYPTGVRRQVVTKIEYDFMKRHNFYCEFLSGFEWLEYKDKYESPFAWVENMFKERLFYKYVTKEDMKQYSLKITLNSTYGKTAQQRPFKGKFTNFFYASYITAGVRLRLAEIVHKYREHVIYVATDGICLTCEVPELEIDDQKLGAWGLTEYAGGVFIGSGMRQMFYKKPDKQGNKFETFARGLTNDRNYNLLADIKKNKNEKYIYSTKRRPLHLGECVAHSRSRGLEDINLFVEVIKRVDVNTDKKHIWSKEYENFGDLLKNRTYAKPPKVNMLADGSYELITSSV